MTGLFTLPWTIKPIYGFISDGVPLFGYRRRSYLTLCGVIGTISYMALGTDFFGLLGGDGVGFGGDNQALMASGGGITMLQITIFSLIVSSACIGKYDFFFYCCIFLRNGSSE